MKDFILTLVVVFVIFRIIGSFRSARVERERRREHDDQPKGFNKDGTRVEYIKDKPDDAEYTDYEIIEEKKKKDDDRDQAG